MEYISLDQDTYDYLTELTIDDFFPKDIFYQPSPITVNKPPQPLVQPSLPKHPPVKHVFQKHSAFVFDKLLPVSCIKSFHNILIIGGGNLIKVYNIETNYELLSTYKFSDEDADCKVNAIAVTQINDYAEVYCVVAGSSPSLHVLNIIEHREVNENRLLGHRNEVYETHFHPCYAEILLSCSKDCTVRLWNILSAAQLAIFGGPDGHLADVLSVAWHSSGAYFASGGVDNSVKMYAINKKLRGNIVKSRDTKERIKTVIVNYPFYSCKDVHDNYVDCLQFNGNFVLSKSVDGVIKEWLPVIKEEGNYYFLINTYVYETKERIFNVKFCLSLVNDIIVVGNEEGKGFVFAVNEAEETAMKDYYFYKNEPVDKFELKRKSLLRVCECSSVYDLLFFGNESGDVFIYELLSNIN